MKFNSFYVNKPTPVGTKLDIETKFVDQSEADRASLSYQLERFGMDSLLQKLELTKSQFGYADTRLTKNFSDYSQSLADANSYFMQLPAKIRKEFGHDPVKFYSKIETDPEYMYKNGYISDKLAKELGVLSLQGKVDNVEPITDSINHTVSEPIVQNNDNVSA